MEKKQEWRQGHRKTNSWLKPATLQIHDTHISQLNCEDTRSYFCCFLHCLSRLIFVINLTLSFPLSQHFLRSILPRLAARRQEGKNARMCFEFWQRMPLQTTHIQIIRSVLLERKGRKRKDKVCMKTNESKDREGKVWLLRKNGLLAPFAES